MCKLICSLLLDLNLPSIDNWLDPCQSLRFWFGAANSHTVSDYKNQGIILVAGKCAFTCKNVSVEIQRGGRF